METTKVACSVISCGYNDRTNLIPKCISKTIILSSYFLGKKLILRCMKYEEADKIEVSGK